ncbi:UNVERIFIED_CONTAM: hypothetical protein NCL1_31943 [Trichonephila clavipes]
MFGDREGQAVGKGWLIIRSFPKYLLNSCISGFAMGRGAPSVNKLCNFFLCRTVSPSSSIFSSNIMSCRPMALFLQHFECRTLIIITLYTKIKKFYFSDIKENEECITKATSESNCFSEVGFDLKEMSRDEAGCKELKKVEDCLFRKVKSECSRNVAIIFIRMYHPMVRLQLKICYARGYLKYY